MRVFFTSAAERDLIDILDWYDKQAPGVGPYFLAELEKLLERVSAGPLQFRAVRGQARRAGVRRFPYHLYFRVREDRIEVFACLHARRDPAHWQLRE